MGLASNHSGHGNQNTCTDEAGEKIAKPAGQRYAQQPEQDVGDDGADDPQNDVHEHAHIAFHEHLGEPAGDTADDDSSYPTDTWIFHIFPFAEPKLVRRENVPYANKVPRGNTELHSARSRHRPAASVRLPLEVTTKQSDVAVVGFKIDIED